MNDTFHKFPPAAWVALLLAAPAAAHDYWLVPETFAPPAGTPVAVRLAVGDDGVEDEERPWQPDRTTALELVTAAGRTDLRAKDRAGEKPAVRLTLPKPGAAVLRMDRDWAHVTLTAEKFEAYLKEEGFADVIKARAAAGETAKPGRERYRRSLKAVLQAGPDPDDTPTRPVGQAFELVPQTAPAKLTAGDKLGVKVLFREKPLAGVRVTARHRAGGTTTAAAATSAADGTATLALPTAGPWLVRAVHLRRCTADPAADWESDWAALTFTVP